MMEDFFLPVLEVLQDKARTSRAFRTQLKTTASHLMAWLEELDAQNEKKTTLEQAKPVHDDALLVNLLGWTPRQQQPPTPPRKPVPGVARQALSELKNQLTRLKHKQLEPGWATLGADETGHQMLCGVYENLILALQPLTHPLDQGDQVNLKGLKRLAEAQSAVFTLNARYGRQDGAQLKVYALLRQYAREHQVFLPHLMASNSARPEDHQDLKEKLNPSTPKSTQVDQEGPLQLTVELRQVRTWLEGKRMLVVGGKTKAHTLTTYQEVFGLADVRWVETSESTNFHALSEHIARQEVDIVLVLIRWVRHSCQALYGLPQVVVRVPSGYNPATVGHHILEQASEKLKAQS